MSGDIKAANWLAARDFQKRLMSCGWKTPDTYDNCYSAPIAGPAVYMFLSYGSDARDGLPDFDRAIVAYVGMSARLCARWKAHLILREIERRSRYLQRWFRPTPESDLRHEELRLIQEYDPPWNIQGRKRGVLLQ
jgi:hypothetical protein